MFSGSGDAKVSRDVDFLVQVFEFLNFWSV